MISVADCPSLLYYAGSSGMLSEVAERLGRGSFRLPEGFWSKRRDLRRQAEEAAEEGKRSRSGGGWFEQLLWDPRQDIFRKTAHFSSGSLQGFFRKGSLPPFLIAWRDGEDPWPFAGAPFPRDFISATHPLLRLRALLPDWPDPDYGRERIHLDVGEQLSAGLLLARAGRYDLLAQVLNAGGHPLLDKVGPVFRASVESESVTELRAALAHHRRADDLLFRKYAAQEDPEPDEQWIEIDWDAVRRSAADGNRQLQEHGSKIVGHPACPLDVRVLAAERWRDRFVWSALLRDRPTGRHLLRELAMKPDLSVAVPLAWVGEGGVTASDVLELAHPADLVLRDAAGLPGIARWHPLQCVITHDDERGAMRLVKGIVELADRYLGDDPGAWTIACRLVEQEFGGSVTELVQRATAGRPQ